MTSVTEATEQDIIGIAEPTNGGKTSIEFSLPYITTFTIQGVADIFFHRWNVESVEAKSKAVKGSTAKKTDDVESYVWRDGDGFICLPGNYVLQSVINAARYRQDPRSPRKSAMDLYRAGLASLTDLAPLMVPKSPTRTPDYMGEPQLPPPTSQAEPTITWQYEDRRRVTVQRQGITRVRPAFHKGWRATVQFLVNLPEYIPPDALHEGLVNAGRLCGVADFRPSYGRFSVTNFAIDVP